MLEGDERVRDVERVDREDEHGGCGGRVVAQPLNREGGRAGVGVVLVGDFVVHALHEAGRDARHAGLFLRAVIDDGRRRIDDDPREVGGGRRDVPGGRRRALVVARARDGKGVVAVCLHIRLRVARHRVGICGHRTPIGCDHRGDALLLGRAAVDELGAIKVDGRAGDVGLAYLEGKGLVGRACVVTLELDGRRGRSAGLGGSVRVVGVDHIIVHTLHEACR